MRAGESRTPRPQPQEAVRTGILPRAADWELLCDTDGQLSFPTHIAVTNKRPDIVLHSLSKRIVVLIELTVPIEDNIGGAYASSKAPRYESLLNECAANGWAPYFFSITVGSRGYCAGSLRDCLIQLGFNKPEANKTVREASLTASRCSYLIYCRRYARDWETPY